MTDPASTPPGVPGLAYTRQLHAELVAANRDLYTRAQTALTLNGLVISVFGAVISASPDDLMKTVKQATGATPKLALGAVLALAVSVAASFVSLYSRHRSGRAKAQASGLENLWFYARIAEQEPEDFIAAASSVTDVDEVQIRLHQVAVAARIMRRRADWLNLAYAAASVGFICFVLAIVSYLQALG